MKKLIDAEELRELLREERCCCPEEFYEIGYNAGIDDAVKAVEKMPDAEKRAEWTNAGLNGTVKCTACQFVDFFARRDRVSLFGFCPGCGGENGRR